MNGCKRRRKAGPVMQAWILSAVFAVFPTNFAYCPPPKLVSSRILQTQLSAEGDDDVNKAWRFASLHGSSIGTRVANGQSHHPLSRLQPFVSTPTAASSATEIDGNKNDRHDSVVVKTSTTAEADLKEAAQAAAESRSETKSTDSPMPKLYQGVYQLTNEEEYRYVFFFEASLIRSS